MKKNHPQKKFKKCFQKSLLTYGNAESLFEIKTRIIILCVLTYIGPIAEYACFSTKCIGQHTWVRRKTAAT